MGLGLVHCNQKYAVHSVIYLCITVESKITIAMYIYYEKMK